MKNLLDTHSLIWFISGDTKLSFHVRQLIDNEENECFINLHQ